MFIFSSLKMYYSFVCEKQKKQCLIFLMKNLEDSEPNNKYRHKLKTDETLMHKSSQ